MNDYMRIIHVSLHHFIMLYEMHLSFFPSFLPSFLPSVRPSFLLPSILLFECCWLLCWLAGFINQLLCFCSAGEQGVEEEEVEEVEEVEEQEEEEEADEGILLALWAEGSFSSFIVCVCVCVCTCQLKQLDLSVRHVVMKLTGHINSVKIHKSNVGKWLKIWKAKYYFYIIK